MNTKEFISHINEGRPTNIFDFIRGLNKHSQVDKIVDLFQEVDGMSALVRLKDGNALEVSVRPARFAKNPSIIRKTRSR